VQDHGHATLVVGDAGAEELVVLKLDGLRGQRAGPVDRIQVGDQHQLSPAAALLPTNQHLALAGARWPTLHLHAQGLEPALGVVCHAPKTRQVHGARFDAHHLLE
jgi:hypothetical protein